MSIINWITQEYLRGQVRRETGKLAEMRAALRRVQSRSPQLRAMVQPEMERVRQLSSRLRKVRSRDELRRWRSLYEMCLPAFRAAIGLAPAKTGRGKQRTKKRVKK